MRLLHYPDLKERGINWTNRHLQDLEKAGRFPRRVRLGNGTVAWVDDEINAYLAAKVAARDKPEC